jgi:hypothetical protein
MGCGIKPGIKVLCSALLDSQIADKWGDFRDRQKNIIKLE